jgi:CYTH domain-containing protein
MASFVAPDFLGKEVTHDTRFAWGVLALMGDEDVKKFLKGIGV